MVGTRMKKPGTQLCIDLRAESLKFNSPGNLAFLLPWWDQSAAAGPSVWDQWTQAPLPHSKQRQGWQCCSGLRQTHTDSWVTWSWTATRNQLSSLNDHAADICFTKDGTLRNGRGDSRYFLELVWSSRGWQDCYLTLLLFNPVEVLKNYSVGRVSERYIHY